MNHLIPTTTNVSIQLNIQTTREAIKPAISNSLCLHMNDINKTMLVLQETMDNHEYQLLEHIYKIVNPFEFIFSHVPGSSVSVSKVKPDSILFFELMELFQMCAIGDLLVTHAKIHVAHLTPNYASTQYFMNMLREEHDDLVISEDFDYYTLYEKYVLHTCEHKFDLMICEFREDNCDTTAYTHNILLIFIIILKYQQQNGMCIIKLENIIYKPVIDVIFMLSSVYDKVYVAKSLISSVTKGERFLICKKFNSTTTSPLWSHVEEHVLPKMDYADLHDKNIFSLIDNPLPYCFLNKLEESNLVIGQQQIEAFDQIISIWKHKNREDKIESLTKTHLQKCIQWCEKNQLPHNKFLENVNIFLHK
jgi:hypothetical protein